MQIDFYNAHIRHWDDAEHLHSEGRMLNADHLYGFSAECGVKFLMKGLGMRTSPSGDPQDHIDRKHIDQLWVRYNSYASGRAIGPKCTLPALNPFDQWNVKDRYTDGSHIDTARQSQHRNAAKTIKDVVNHVRHGGI